MNDVTAACLGLAAAYLIGSIPFGLMIGKLVAGIDIREAGSGNIGATNVGRVLGARWGIAALILDGMKGLLPTLLLPRLLGQVEPIHLTVGCGIFTIVGHMFPCWLKFRGGKGVATALGVIVILSPIATLGALVIFAATFWWRRIVALSSILAAIAFAICQIFLMLPTPFSPENWSLAAFSLLAPLLIVVRHRSNIQRLLRGEEKQYRTAKKPEPSTSATPGDANSDTDDTA